MKSTPPESEWTAEDLANQRRVDADINKALERMYIRMVLSIAAVAALLATAIHFLGKQ